MRRILCVALLSLFLAGCATKNGQTAQTGPIVSFELICGPAIKVGFGPPPTSQPAED